MQMNHHLCIFHGQLSENELILIEEKKFIEAWKK